MALGTLVGGELWVRGSESKVIERSQPYRGDFGKAGSGVMLGVSEGVGVAPLAAG